MGNTCKHERTELVEVLSEDKGILFANKIIMVKCKDCMTNGEPTLIRKEVNQGRLTGHIYCNNDVNKNNCKHENFTVDSTTEQYCHRESLSGVLVGMLTAHWFEPKCHYIIAVATCDKCGSKFHVECSYTKENKWENYQQKKIENRGNWNIVYETKDEKKSVISYVES